MSGIAAGIGDIGEDEAARVLERLSHRAGPEGSDPAKSSLNVGDRWIGSQFSTRLGPGQPVRTPGSRFAMVVDGELYGSREGESPRDWSAVLAMFGASGTDVLAGLEGSFALVILSQDGQMVVARDPLGIKPLYWARRGDAVRFASEVGAFDPEWLDAVEFFPPGHHWSPETGLQRFAPDIRKATPVLTGAPASPSFLPALLEDIRDGLVESVQREMLDDTSVAAFLSGGLDSSLIAAIASRWMADRGSKLKTYAVGMDPSPDLEAAREVADFLDTDHVEVTYTDQDALEVVPEVVEVLENFDPTLVRSSVANYLLAERAADDADVVLSGEGADELFAGYEYLRNIDSDEALDQELRLLIANMHQGGLQRVDRTTMAHGLQARMPFLTKEMIDLGMAIPASLKRADETHPEKQLLREAFRGWLPDDILWRKKAQFGDGSGAVDALSREITSGITEADLEAGKDVVTPALRTREELAYYRLFANALPGARAEAIVGRFATA